MSTVDKALTLVRQCWRFGATASNIARARELIERAEAADAAQAKVAKLHDYATHHHDWARACEIALNAADSADEADYWRHQIKTLDALNSASRGVG